jgi:hypothetical protein
MYRSPPYKYLKITSITSKNSDGYNYKAAHCLNLESGKETTFNDKLFDNVPQGTCFMLKEGGGIETFPEEKLEEYFEAWRGICQHREEEAKRIRTEKEASGRFRWWSFPDTYKEGMVWECEAERVADKVEDFWEAVAHVMSSRTFRKIPLTVEQIKKNERLIKFMDSAEEGDILEYVVAYRDPLAASGDLQIVRDGFPVAHYNLWVS